MANPMVISASITEIMDSDLTALSHGTSRVDHVMHSLHIMYIWELTFSNIALIKFDADFTFFNSAFYTGSPNTHRGSYTVLASRDP